MIKKFTIIKTDNRLRNIACPEDEINNQMEEGDVLSDDFYSNELYKYDGVNFVLKTEDEKVLNKTLAERVSELETHLLNAGVALPQHRERIKALSKQACIDLINQAAGRARFRFVSQGTLINEEYQLAANQVQIWRTAGSPTNDVPPTLSSWATASGMSTELAAQNIEATAAAYNSALESIRDTRLTGNAAVASASENFADIAQTYINTLDAL